MQCSKGISEGTGKEYRERRGDGGRVGKELEEVVKDIELSNSSHCVLFYPLHNILSYITVIHLG